MGCVSGKNILDEDDLSFLMSHTKMEEEEVRRRYARFIKNHPDGRLDPESFQEMINICYPLADKENIEKHIFRLYDYNQVCRDT